MEDLKQTPPASIESDAPSEYMRGYSDGLAQAEETIAAAIQRAKAEEREACAVIAKEVAAAFEKMAAETISNDRAIGYSKCARSANAICQYIKDRR